MLEYWDRRNAGINKKCWDTGMSERSGDNAMALLGYIIRHQTSDVGDQIKKEDAVPG
jgi:hypothetical protein